MLSDVHRSGRHVKYPVFLSDCNEQFFRQIFDKWPNIKFQKIRSAGAELFHVDGQTDMTKLRAAFRNFVTAPNMTDCLAVFSPYILCR